MDNVRRVVTQGTTVEGKPSLVFPRQKARSFAEFLTTAGQLGELGFSPGDVQTFAGRLLQYLVSSPLRRATELQNLSAYDFFIGRDANVARRYYYTPPFEAVLLEMPRVLAAFDSRWGDARTNLTTYLQLQLQTDRDDDKADGVLNGPTTEAWFDHWYRHLVELGVRFVRMGVERLVAPRIDRGDAPHRRPRVQVQLTDGMILAPDYVVVAVDAPAAERITAPLRAAGTGGTVAGLEGFTTSVPPPRGPLQPTPARPSARRDPYVLGETGRLPWDRFQTLAGIQYFFDTEFQLLRGHMYYAGTEWGLSSINQSGMWERQRTLARDGHVSVLSVDIGDFNSPSRHLLDESGHGKAARDCTADELAQEVWRQITHAVTSDAANAPEALLPWPAWYALDRNLRMSAGPDDQKTPARNEAPYLVPIVGDWPNRPGCDPWNPHGSSWTTRSTEVQWLRNLEQWNVWQARHGGYQVHHNSVVFAGTWTKTFTRMTSMEAACESARHAVNAVLDHYVWVESGGVDRREKTILNWVLPFGFIDQGFSSPIRLPTPAGDYCYVFDVENREPYETRTLRNLDTKYCLASQPHPIDFSGANSGPPVLPAPSITGGQHMTSPTPDQAQQLLGHLQAWRQHLERAVGAMAPTQYVQPPGWGMSVAPPPAPFMPPSAPFMPPSAPFMPPPMPAAMATPPTDYIQQLLACLQAWRQYLEHMGAAAEQPSAAAAGQPGPAARPPIATLLQPDQVADSTPVDSTPGPTTWGSTPQAQEYVVPEHGSMSHIAFKEKRHPEGDLFSGNDSLYDPSRSYLSSSPMAQYQPNSPFMSARSVTSAGSVSAAQGLVHSNFATPTARGQEEKAVPSSRPEELELIMPLVEAKK
jgi:hypothetical protein